VSVWLTAKKVRPGYAGICHVRFKPYLKKDTKAISGGLLPDILNLRYEFKKR
jgi:hypothetical protein